MVKKKSKKKTNKKKKSKKPNKDKKESVIKEHGKKAKKLMNDYINKELKIPATIVLVLLIVLVFALVKVPYEVREQYTEIVVEEETYLVEVEDTENPIEVEKCELKKSRLEITNHYTYTEPYGNYDYFCVGEFRAMNHEKEEGEWTFEYVFDVSGKEVVTEPITKKIAGLSPTIFEFRSDECQEKDQDLNGEYVLISEPTKEECTYVTEYPKITIEKTREVEREVPKERIITEQESLWARLFGLNKGKKV